MEKKTVLFVCVHNSGRSQMAEAFFNHFAGNKALGLSAGTQPSDKINPVVVQVMQESGLEIGDRKPKLLTLDMVERADRVITMGCGVESVCPASFIPAEDWQIQDPEGKSLESVRKIRDEIKHRVKNLLSALDISQDLTNL